jgi:hypothetical protein
MARLERFDGTFAFIMGRMIESGIAPHDTELARSRGLGMETATSM